MTKCPFCHFDNEDGALFCEQCKSDLGGVPVSVPAAAIATAEPVVEAVVAEAVPVEAEAVEAVEAIAEPAGATAEPVDAIPFGTAEAVPVMAEADAGVA